MRPIFELTGLFDENRGTETPEPVVVERYRVLVEVGIEKRDAWVGLYWNRREQIGFGGVQHRFFDVYVCPLPFCVLHVQLRKKL